MPFEDMATLEPETTLEWLPALRAFARSLTRDKDEADDLVQETLLKAIRHRKQFHQGTNLRAWLFTIMRNTFYNARAKSSRECTGSTDCVSSQVSVASTQEWTIRGKEVMAAIGRLPVHYRETIVLVIMLEESYKTSAEICQVSMGTIKSRLYRARAKVIEDIGDGEI